MDPDGRDQASGLSRAEGSRADVSPCVLAEQGADRAPSERPDPLQKLLHRRDFQACYKEGRRAGGRYSTLFYRPNEEGHPRFGITATRKVGKAVLRQKAKRRFREIYRRWPERHSIPPLDLVVHLKPAVTDAAFEDLQRDFTHQLSVASGLIKPRRRPHRRSGRGERR